MKTFLYADPHFGHQGMCEFKRDDGSKLRPWDHRDEMDAALIERYRETVKKDDKVYFLGDVAMKPQNLEILHKLPGDKVLIKGNHDQAKMSIYARYFRDIRSCWQLGGCLLTHIPIHPECLSRWKANIHGHLHYRSLKDPRYICVSVEHTDFRPIEFTELQKRVGLIDTRKDGA